MKQTVRQIVIKNISEVTGISEKRIYLKSVLSEFPLFFQRSDFNMVINLLETDFSMTIPAEDAREWNTVGDIIKYINKSLDE